MSDTLSDNPLVEIRTVVPFDRIRPEHIQPAIEYLLADVRSRLDAIAHVQQPRTYDNTMAPLDQATARLEYAMEVLGLLESVATTPALREAYNTVQPLVSAFESAIPLNEQLWQAIAQYAASDEARRLTGARQRFVTKTVDYFRRHGADLDRERKRRLQTLAAELSEATTRFAQNVLDATNNFELIIEDEHLLSGLPDSAKTLARESARARGLPGWRFTLHAPSYIPAITYLDNANIREQLWRAYNTRATKEPTDNRPLIAQILRLRREQATLLGYPTFADLVLHDRMARTAAQARAFIHQLEERTRPYALKEDAELLAFRRTLEGPEAPPLQPWDVAYYAEKQRRARYHFDEEALRPYLSVDSVLEGMFEIARRLYGVRVEPRPDTPVWHPDVRTYTLFDHDDTAIGLFYVDLHPRENKRDGAWMNGLISTPAGHGLQVGVFCANVTPPTDHRPALLTHREVETLFHEFGHLLHHCLSRVEVRSLSGTRVAWDFVELPSQIMENWCWEKEALDLFARHYETGHPIPEELFTQMLRARTYRAANAQMRQLGFAALDLALHCDYDPDRDGDVMAYARTILQRFSPAPLPDDYAMVAAFGHLFSSPVGYAAGYYSYKWAEVLDADAFTRFKQEGVLSPTAGRAFRETILSRGDSASPEELYRAFMGRDAQIDALFQRLGLTER